MSKATDGSDGEESAMQKPWVPPLGQEDPLENGPATQSSIFAWRIPRSLEGLHSLGSQRIRHDWTTNTFLQVLG